MNNKSIDKKCNPISSPYKRLKVLLLDQRDQLSRKDRQNQLLKEKANQKLGYLRSELEKCQLDFANERSELEQTIAKLNHDNQMLLQRIESLNTGMLQSGSQAYFKAQKVKQQSTQEVTRTDFIETDHSGKDDAPVHLEFSNEHKEIFAKYFS